MFVVECEAKKVRRELGASVAGWLEMGRYGIPYSKSLTYMHGPINADQRVQLQDDRSTEQRVQTSLHHHIHPVAASSRTLPIVILRPYGLDQIQSHADRTRWQRP